MFVHLQEFNKNPISQDNVNQSVGFVHTHGPLTFPLALEWLVVVSRGLHDFGNSNSFDLENPEHDLFANKFGNFIKLLVKLSATGDACINFHSGLNILQFEVYCKSKFSRPGERFWHILDSDVSKIRH